MSDKNIWDSYANWSDVSNLESIGAVKEMIVGPTGAWQPNYISPTLAQAMETAVRDLQQKNQQPPVVMDFGCGLGRNAALLKRFFPRVIGYDMPEMIRRLREEHPRDLDKVYDAVYDDLTVLAAKEKVHALFDSVVFQHILDINYAKQMTDSLMALPGLSILITLGIRVSATLYYINNDYPWRPMYAEVDWKTFNGIPHLAMIFRRD